MGRNLTAVRVFELCDCGIQACLGAVEHDHFNLRSVSR
jgi:hypothetical protein